MLRRLILPIVLVGLAGCGQGFPEAIPATVPTTAATTTTTIADTPTTPPPPTDPPTTPAPPTEPPTTPAPTTAAPAPTTTAPAPTTAAPAPPTTTKATEATEPPKPKPEPAPAGNFEVLTVAGLGSPITNAEIIKLIDDSGLTADSAAEYGTYGGPANLPFVNVETGRLSSIDIRTGDTVAFEYVYVLQPADGATPEAIATAAAAPLKQKYPDYGVQTRQTNEGNLTIYAIELDSPAGSKAGDWTVYGIINADLPGVARVSIDYYDSPDDPATGLDLVPARYRDAVKAPFDEAGAPVDRIVESRTDVGVDHYGDGLVGLEVVVEYEQDKDYATVKEMLKGLADKGWTIEEEDDDEAVYYTKGNTELRLANNDEYEYTSTKLRLKLEQ